MHGQHKYFPWLTVVSFLTSTLVSPLSGEDRLSFFPGNHGFIHETGVHVPGGWSARYRSEAPGYFIRGLAHGNQQLPAGIYRYWFYFSLPPGRLGGLFRKANDVVRLEVWDRETHQRLAFRTLQQADFPTVSKKLIPQSIVFSIPGRAVHSVEPKLYWQGLESLFLQRVELERLDAWAPELLPQKADHFEKMMADYLDRGMVVARRDSGDPEDVGDTAIWTGLYAAAEAWRYQSDRSEEALNRMEGSLRAMHALHVHASHVGTLARYIDANGRALPLDASKDTYTGFFFAVAQCWPWIRDPQLKTDLEKDVEAIAGHFLDHDLSFQPGPASERLEFNPYLSESLLNEAFQDVMHDADVRHQVIHGLSWAQDYFRVQRQRGWRETKPMIKALRRNNPDAMRRALVPLVRGAIPALHQFRDNVQRSARVHSIGPASETPYGRLLVLLNRALGQLPEPGDIRDMKDVKVLPSESLHALHFIKVAAEILPKPNRFDAYYQENLWKNKALLKTVIAWTNIDEDLFDAVWGHTHAAAHRSSSNHLTYLALYDLVFLEKDTALRQSYQAVFLQEANPMQDEFNAMVEIMRAAMGAPSPGVGLGWWSLERYPEDRQGHGERYWQANEKRLVARYGRSVSGQSRDPIPVDERPRDCFLWQRSARSLRGDDAHVRYPPMDYLFVYWLARAHPLTLEAD